MIVVVAARDTDQPKRVDKAGRMPAWPTRRRPWAAVRRPTGA
ncbi:hypothetical protein BURCENBC7_AP6582 [Burkholderia cenocepacia BC7]|nr:hypothetical protein BURCENBC7_AP6582 [Burkholderia cenocepacia BC7]